MKVDRVLLGVSATEVEDGSGVSLVEALVGLSSRSILLGSCGNGGLSTYELKMSSENA
jgi:hypothetical protein